MNLFQKANARLNLTPGERAILKLLQSLGFAGVTAVVAAVPAILAYMNGQQQVTWGLLLLVAGIFIHGFMAAWAKYTSAKGDAPLTAAITSADVAIQQRLPQAPNALKSPA